MIDNNLWVPFEKLDEWHRYKLLVDRETRRNKDLLFKEWDGNCYYLKTKLKKLMTNMIHIQLRLIIKSQKDMDLKITYLLN